MLTFNFTPFPVLETGRLILRRLVSEDVNEIFELRSDPENMKYIPRPLAANLQEAMQHIAMIDEKIINNEGINWAITLKKDPKLIGIIGHYRIRPENFRSEVGYMILPQFSGQGFTTEAITAVLDYGFEVMKLHSVEAIIDPANIGSERVLQKNGFIKEAHLIENEFYEGKFLDTVIYSLLKRNFNHTIAK